MNKVIAGIGAALGLGALPAGCGDDQYNIDMDGTAMYCVRDAADYSGNSDLGFFVNAELHMVNAGWLKKVGVRTYGDSVTEFGAVRFETQWHTKRAHYSLMSPHNLAIGQVDEAVVYAVNNDGSEAEFNLELVDCETLDAVLR